MTAEQAVAGYYERREAIGLAFMVALRRLPPRQRAVLVLRDVLPFRAADVADMLGATEVAVNRPRHRARRAMDRDAGPGTVAEAPVPDSAEERALVARFANAFPVRRRAGRDRAADPRSAATSRTRTPRSPTPTA